MWLGKKGGSARGITLIELMIVVAIMGLLSLMFRRTISNVWKEFKLAQVKIELQREGRLAINSISRDLKQASLSTLRIGPETLGEPQLSSMTFTKTAKTSGGPEAQVSYFARGTDLVRNQGGQEMVLSKNLAFLAFVPPRSNDMSVLSVSLKLEKPTYDGQTKSFSASLDKVKILTP